MNRYYYYLENSRQRWWFWWNGEWRKANDGMHAAVLPTPSFFFLPSSFYSRALIEKMCAHRSQIFGSGSLLCPLHADLSNKETFYFPVILTIPTSLILFHSVGRRYPAVNIVILTPVSFKYAFGKEPLTEPPQDSSTGSVISIKDMKEWQSHWDSSARYNKLVCTYQT